jgi:hypothetical protein
MAQVLGRAIIRWGGRTIESEKGASLDTGGVRRNVVVYGRKVGHAEETAPAMLECVTALEAGAAVAEWNALKEATATFEADTGQVYVIRDAFLTEPLKMTDGEGGKVAFKLAGSPAEELV